MIKEDSKELLDLIFPTLPIAIFYNALLTSEDLYKCGKDSGLDLTNFAPKMSDEITETASL